MATVIKPPSTQEMVPRSRGLAVVASARDALAALELLSHETTDWTVLALFGTEQLNCEGMRLVHAGFEDRGWHSRYNELRPALRDRLARIEEADGPFDVLATHGAEDLDAHPAIWQIANVLAGDRLARRVDEFALHPAGRRERSANRAKENAALLRWTINGQIVQEPRGKSPGIVVSPFWNIPWDRREAVRQAMLRQARADSWYAIMADTTFGNLPPNYVLPFIGGRFCVDPIEHRFLAGRLPDLDLIPFCQGQLTPEAIYKPAAVEKQFDLVYSARICEVKRHALLLDALEVLQRAGHRLRTLLLFYPKDNEDTRTTTEMVRRRTADSGLDVTFHSTGERGNDEAGVALMLSRCRVGVFMSAEEGPAFAIPEYLLCNLPVVACSSLLGGGLYFLNGENSLLFDDANDLPRVLLEAVEACEHLQPRQSALAQGIGEQAGNARFRECLAERGILVRDDARPLLRHLEYFRLQELCR